MFDKWDRRTIEETFLNVLSWASIAALIAAPFLLLFVAKESPGCLVKTTERGSRLHIVLDCPMIPSSAHEASTDEK